MPKSEFMRELNFPAYPLKIKLVAGKKQVFDPIRKKFLILTPEEWVRQHLIQFLIKDNGYPASLLAIESMVKYNSMNRRSDLVAYNRKGKPVLLAECKAPSVKINQEAFDQVARYNVTLGVKYLIVTNGLVHYACYIDHTHKKVEFLDSLPSYEDIDSSD